MMGGNTTGTRWQGGRSPRVKLPRTSLEPHDERDLCRETGHPLVGYLTSGKLSTDSLVYSRYAGLSITRTHIHTKSSTYIQYINAFIRTHTYILNVLHACIYILL